MLEYQLKFKLTLVTAKIYIVDEFDHVSRQHCVELRIIKRYTVKAEKNHIRVSRKKIF